jgi:hypothetical protein
MTLAGIPAFDKSGDLVFRSFEDQMKEDKSHDLLTLNRQRAVTLTHDSFAAFSKLLRAKKRQRRPKVTTTFRQDAIRLLEHQKRWKTLIGQVHQDAKTLERDRLRKAKAEQKRKEREKLPRPVRKPAKPVSSARTPHSSSSSAHKSGSLKRKRELDDSESEKPKPR